jgi:hypothetical protein
MAAPQFHEKFHFEISKKGVVGELMALVSGAQGHNGHGAKAHGAGGLKTGLTAMRHSLGRHKGPAASRPPEQVIPLEDDNFKDFKKTISKKERS